MKAAIIARYAASATLGSNPASSEIARTFAITCSTRFGASTSAGEFFKLGGFVNIGAALCHQRDDLSIEPINILSNII
jgi:hypothetical protein